MPNAEAIADALASDALASTPWLLCALGAAALLLTVNALWPVRGVMLLAGHSFFAGWLTGELALHHLAFQTVAAMTLSAAGGAAAWPGWLGLSMCAPAWLGLWFLYREGGRASDHVERALSGSLGASYRSSLPPDVDAPLPLGRLLVPFWLTDPSVRVIKNIRYAEGAGRRHLLDIYLPKRPVENAPVLFQIHGGAWVIGHKAQQARPLLHYMAARGFVCVSVNYRLSPRAKWPEHLIDVKQALAWVRENIAAHGGDPRFVVATGGSAGGYLTAMLALTQNEPRFQPGFAHIDTSLQGAIPFYAPFDLLDRARTQRHMGLRMLAELAVIGKSKRRAPELFRDASPVSHVRADAPPFLVVHGTHDSLTSVEEARFFVTQLREISKSPVAYVELPYAQHAFEVFHSPRTLHAIRGVHRFARALHAQRERGLTPEIPATIHEDLRQAAAED